MPVIPILMPQLGESIAEAVVMDIRVAPGEAVKADQEIIEVETDKAVMTVTTPCDGIIKEITAKTDVSYAVGASLGLLEVAATATDSSPSEAPSSVEEEGVHFKVADDALPTMQTLQTMHTGIPDARCIQCKQCTQSIQ